ncbi:MAG: LuxR C-terminal-related transcriptional regulator [Gallionella sp.]|nr:LuxR C-terminal-related transcriptional regulator [Gallionella sp.]
MKEASAGMVVVIDEDMATLKGILRIASEAGFAARAFSDCRGFAEWINTHASDDAVASRSFCLVVDVRSLPSEAAWYANEHIRTIPKICIGTPAATAATGQLLNLFQGEFVRKPFTLLSIRAQIQDAFARHASLASEELQSRGVLAMFTLLTKREHEVAGLVGSGSSNLDIAQILGITLKTVKAHRAKVMKKTRSSTIADFVRKFERYRQANLKLEDGALSRDGRFRSSV